MIVVGRHRRRTPDSEVRDAQHLAEIVGSAETAERLISMHAIRFRPAPESRTFDTILGALFFVAVGAVIIAAVVSH